VNLLEERIESAVAIKNILFATDFSAISEAALPYVAALSLRYGGTVHVAHVLPNAVLLRPGAPDPSIMGSIYEDVHSAAQEKIQHLGERLRGYPHKTYVRHGEVLDVITEIVREQEIDLLVLGTHGRTGLGKLIMGSVAEELFRGTVCPVLTVGPQVASVRQVLESRRDQELPPAQAQFGHILCATDFSPDAAKIASYAVSLAREFQSRFTLLHVIEDFGDYLHGHPGPIDNSLRRLEELVPNQDGLGYRPDFVAEYGSPAAVILQTAGEYEADLIILGARPAADRLAFGTHFGGSVAHKVLVGAICPVLTIRSYEDFAIAR
jgi:nucleotide-binding universal stress UspA family protein